MPTPGENKTVQARILAYAEAIYFRQGYGGQVGWTIVSREVAEERRGGIPAPLRGKVGDRNVPAPLSLFFDDLLDANPPSPRGCGVAKVREFNPRYAESKGALLGRFPPSPRLRRTSHHLHTDIHSNPAFRFSFIALCLPYDQDHHSS